MENFSMALKVDSNNFSNLSTLKGKCWWVDAFIGLQSSLRRCELIFELDLSCLLCAWDAVHPILLSPPPSSFLNVKLMPSFQLCSTLIQFISQHGCYCITTLNEFGNINPYWYQMRASRAWESSIYSTGFQMHNAPDWHLTRCIIILQGMST